MTPIVEVTGFDGTIRIRPSRWNYRSRSSPLLANQCASAVFTRMFMELRRSRAISRSFLCSARGSVMVVSRTIRSSAETRRALARSVESSASNAIAERSPLYRISNRKGFVDALVEAYRQLD